MQSRRIYSLLFMLSALMACNSNDTEKSTTDTTTEKTAAPNVKKEDVSYTADTVTMKGVVMYDANKQGKRPAVLIIHEWWGLNEYPRMRAEKLAELGYVAMAVDLFGNGKTVDNPTDAQNLATPLYQNPQMAKARFDAALNKLKTYAEVDTTKIAAIGYCFGGGMVLNIAKLGENLNGVVSFHGLLMMGVPANKDLLKAKMLVCHGAADTFVPQKDVDQFRRQLDSIGADYTFKSYPDSKHAFTNPRATEVGQKFKIDIAYNAAADSASWNDMQEFFGTIFK